jgi:hypothetical protein
MDGLDILLCKAMFGVDVFDFDGLLFIDRAVFWIVKVLGFVVERDIVFIYKIIIIYYTVKITILILFI